jgi:3-deoxy-D-manno-octulosonate 8-phosphate phosphatase (KDO 8-P phosphatase)
MPISESELLSRMAGVKAVVLDADGVLTDGRLIVGQDGQEMQVFDVRDGFGIRALLMSGIRVALISGRRSEAVRLRCEYLGVSDVFQDVQRKAALFDSLVVKYGINPAETCYVGDDINDIAVLKHAGLSVCVRDACEELKSLCHMVTSRRGGRGAIREVAQGILRAQGKWDGVLGRFA